MLAAVGKAEANVATSVAGEPGESVACPRLPAAGLVNVHTSNAVRCTIGLQ
jgi:hypothetical protein